MKQLDLDWVAGRLMNRIDDLIRAHVRENFDAVSTGKISVKDSMRARDDLERALREELGSIVEVSKPC